jgi:hypothetical protein
MRFFKWLYYPDIEPGVRPYPSVIENIPSFKRKETSIYKPTDIWSEGDDVLFLKYCHSKRIRCYHTVSRDTSCRPHEILKLRMKDIVFKTSGNYQYAEVLVNGKTGSRHIPLIHSIPYVKDYLDHEHPHPSNPNAIFICANGKSSARPLQNGNKIADSNPLQQRHLSNQTESFANLQSSKDAMQGKSGSLVESFNNTKMFIAYQPVRFAATTWAVLLMQPYNDVLSSLRK